MYSFARIINLEVENNSVNITKESKKYLNIVIYNFSISNY